MTPIKELETKLDEVVNKKAPQLSAGAKNMLFRWSPWIALVVGVLSLLAGISLWHTAHGIQNSTYVVKQLCSTYAGGDSGCDIPNVTHLNFWVWVAVIFLIIQGVLYLRAYPRLRDKQKSGWNFLYYAALVNVAYAIVTLFTSYDVFGHFLGALISAVVTFYLLFQTRPLFLNGAHLATAPIAAARESQAIEVAPVVAEPTPVSKPAAKQKSTAKKKKA